MTSTPYTIQKVFSGRWVVRDAHGTRKGEVFGSSSRFQAQTMRGSLVGFAKTRAAAAELLLTHDSTSQHENRTS